MASSASTPDPTIKPELSPLDSARKKAFRRLLPILFVSYLIAYIDRNNVAVAKLNMRYDHPWFDEAVYGLGAALFFVGYFLLEIPGSLMVERWSARKWICRIMVSWGLMAGLTAFVTSPTQFYWVRFLLGLAEAGFFPGVIVYLTHWFPRRDRARALSLFLVATPAAQVINPLVARLILPVGTSREVDGALVTIPDFMGLAGWQWVFIIWALPAIILGFIVLFFLTDKPHQAAWLTPQERQALESELERERMEMRGGKKRMGIMEAFRHPKVLLLTLAYFCVVSCSYGMEFFMPSIIKEWYSMDIKPLMLFIILPPMVALVAQLACGWSSDHFNERRFHAVVPLVIGACAVCSLPFLKGNVWITVGLMMVAFAGFKGYMPAFWSLPSLFLVEAAAASSIGLINSVGNLGGFMGSFVMGKAREMTGSYDVGLWYLSGSMLCSAIILFFMGIGKREKAPD
ncbi:sugar phosphate permease [Roseimicrobium gellanilyticum]|uniref:Sugar phosphate permease n=1 Tax=Roseimicrobium gellanilyticum TaxID=748857 RepID=A0A366HSQ7_9BACT|nr:MFS transporter [Roseimicrobium gellanilyticum]RBP46138.1 sugar phosphate permease [Roseimicrobium gellanilyticum]